MTEWFYSVVLLVPQQWQSSGNQLAEAMGHGPNNFSVPLSADGNEPATHYGCRSQAKHEFVHMLEVAAASGFPPIIPEANEIFSHIISDAAFMEDGNMHFNRVLENNNLKIVG